MRIFCFILAFLAANISIADICFKEQGISATISQNASTFSFSFDFQNTSNYPVKILKIATTCACTKAKSDKEVYLPNEPGKISGEFEIGSRTGVQNKKIFVETDDPKNPKITLSLNLTIPVLAEFRPKMLYWQKGAGLGTKTLHVDTAREYGARIQKVSCNSENFKIDFTPQKENTDSCEIKITPLSLNEVSKAEVELECVAKNNERKIYKAYLLIR